MRRSMVPSLLMVSLLAFSSADPVRPATTTTTSASVPPRGRARFACFIIMSRLHPRLPFLDVGLPGAVDAALDRLVGGALLGIACQQPVHLLPASCGNLKAVVQANLGNAHHAVYVFDVSLDLGHEVVCRLNPPHVQCGSQGAGQSASDPGDDVIEGGGVLRAGDLPPVLLLVEPLDAAVDAEVDRLREVLDVGGAVWAFVLLDAQTAGVNNAHGVSPVSRSIPCSSNHFLSPFSRAANASASVSGLSSSKASPPWSSALAMKPKLSWSPISMCPSRTP